MQYLAAFILLPLGTCGLLYIALGGALLNLGSHPIRAVMVATVTHPIAIPVPISILALVPAVQVCFFLDYNPSLHICIQNASTLPRIAAGDTYVAWSADAFKLDFQTRGKGGKWVTRSTASPLPAGPIADTLDTHAFRAPFTRCGSVPRIVAFDTTGAEIGSTKVTLT